MDGASADEKTKLAKLLDPPAVYRAAIWRNYGFEAIEDKAGVSAPDKSKVICRHCRTSVKYSGNTTNLMTHMQRHHPEILVKCESGKSVNDTLNKPGVAKGITQSKLNFDKQLQFTSSRSEAITRSIAEFIVKDLRPFSVVVNEGFKRMVHMLEPRYKLPSRPYFSDKVIPEMYAEVKAQLEQDLKAAQSVSVTSDGWTSRNTESYVTVTCHFISPDWKMHSCVLETEILSESHTAVNVANELLKCFSDWNICEKTFAVVTDNASNMVAAMERLPQHHMRCFAHTLNLASQKAMKVAAVSKVLAKIRRTVTFYHKSAIATHVLKEKQLLLNLPEHKLKMDVPTRWNSSYEMVQRYLEQQPAVHAAMLSKEIRKKQSDLATFSDSDLTVAEDIVVVMKPMKTATVALSEDTGPTISMVNPLYQKLLNDLSPKPDDSFVTKEMKRIMHTDLQSRYKGDQDFLVTASALDPRFKGLPFLDDVSKHQMFSKLAVITSEIVDHEIQVKLEPEGSDARDVEPPLPLLPELSDVPEDAEADTVAGPDSSSDSSPDQKKKIKLECNKPESGSVLHEIFGDTFITKVEVKQKSSIEMAQDEILRYQNADTPHLNSCPLSWWRENSIYFPKLSKVAKRYLSVPATSVPSERVFSTAGDVVTAQRSALKPKHVNRLIFLKKNLKFE